MVREVAVTGLGVVMGAACGVQPLMDALRSATMPCSEVDRVDGYHLPESARRAVIARDLDLSAWVPRAEGRRMSPPSKLALAAARMALADAGLSDAAGGSRTTVVLASAFGAVHFTERMLRDVFLESPLSATPFLFTESVANAAAAQVAIATGAQGPNLTVAQREAGVLTAVGRGAAEVAQGRADRALVGGVDEMPPLLHALLDRFEALARPDASGAEVARPFDRRRSGFVASEGAVVLVLEARAAAQARGAQVLARVQGFGGGFDPSAPRVGWGTGHAALARSLRRALERAGVASSDVGRIVSGASGAVAGDRLEAHTLRAAWGDARLPPVLAPKGVTGQYGGGFLAAAVLCARDPTFAPPTAGFTEADPELGLTPYMGGPVSSSGSTLVTCVGSGGAAAWLLLGQP
jgi:3-oxoacyl-[acyl-carrier-protein] synthase II